MAPENSLDALLNSVADPQIAGLECDILLSRDREPYLFHDATTQRLTGYSANFEALPTDQIDSLRVGSHGIPRLATFIDALLSVRQRGRQRDRLPFLLNIELKTTPRANALVQAVAPYLRRLVAAGAGAGYAPLVSSFDPRILFLLRASLPDLPLALLFEDLSALKALHYLHGSDTIDLHPRHDLVTAALLSEYGAPGRAFRAWTVNDADEATRLIDHGVDALITDTPHALMIAQ